MFRRIVAALCVASTVVLGLTACGAPEEGSKQEKVATKAKMQCDPPKGYVKAGTAAKAGLGQFFLCRTSDTKPCKIFIKYKNDLIKEHDMTLYQQGFTTVPKNSKSWRTENCTVYKNDRKGAKE